MKRNLNFEKRLFKDLLAGKVPTNVQGAYMMLHQKDAAFRKAMADGTIVKNQKTLAIAEQLVSPPKTKVADKPAKKPAKRAATKTVTIKVDLNQLAKARDAYFKRMKFGKYAKKSSKKAS